MKRAELALEDGADAAKFELHPKIESQGHSGTSSDPQHFPGGDRRLAQ